RCGDGTGAAQLFPARVELRRDQRGGSDRQERPDARRAAAPVVRGDTRWQALKLGFGVRRSAFRVLWFWGSGVLGFGGSVFWGSGVLVFGVRGSGFGVRGSGFGVPGSGRVLRSS